MRDPWRLVQGLKAFLQIAGHRVTKCACWEQQVGWWKPCKALHCYLCREAACADAEFTRLACKE